MKSEVLNARVGILAGRAPSLAIAITRQIFQAPYLFMASDRFGKGWRKLQKALSPKPIPPPVPAPFKIL